MNDDDDECNKHLLDKLESSSNVHDILYCVFVRIYIESETTEWIK